jgi:hypothetical protein
LVRKVDRIRKMMLCVLTKLVVYYCPQKYYPGVVPCTNDISDNTYFSTHGPNK